MPNTPSTFHRDTMTGEYDADRLTADAEQDRRERGWERTPLIQSTPDVWTR